MRIINANKHKAEEVRLLNIKFISATLRVTLPFLTTGPLGGTELTAREKSAELLGKVTANSALHTIAVNFQQIILHLIDHRMHLLIIIIVLRQWPGKAATEKR